MSEVTYDFSSLPKALGQLKKSFSYLKSDLANDWELAQQFKSACVLGFGFTYELAIKSIRRQLSLIVSHPREEASVWIKII